MKGDFSVSGWYTNIVPGCMILPLIEVNAVRIGFPFGGMLEISEEGELTGQLLDNTGLATISGKMEDGKLQFEKKYTTGDFVEQPPVVYVLEIDDEASTDIDLVFRGGYRFSADQKSDDGHVVMSLGLSIFQTKQLHGCSHGHE